MMPDQVLELLAQYGANVSLAFVVVALIRGWLRLPQEIDAERSRRERAEHQVDTLLPALDRLADLIEQRLVRGGPP